MLLDIWAPWCGPCKTLGPVLERLETQYDGRFKLVKLNADEEPEIAQQLSQMFGVRSIPFCVLFKGGQPVDGFVGALPEAEVRKFLDKHVPSADEMAALDDVAEAEELLDEGDTDSAIDKLQAALATNPANDTARHDYIRALISAGRIEDARAGLRSGRRQPGARRAAGRRRPLDRRRSRPPPKARAPEALAAAIAADKRDFDARFELAQMHFARSEFTQAMDELLEILMRDKAWKDELARKTYVAILQVMTKPPPAPGKGDARRSGALEIAGKVAATSSDPVVDAYRRKLSMAMF